MLIFFLFQKGATHHGSFSEFLFDFIHGGIEPALFFKIRFWLAADNQLVAYKHDGFWQCMDTQREKEKLEQLWASGNAPWKVWNN